MALPTDRPEWVEIDPLGNTRRTFGCVGGLGTRFHDLIVRPDSSYWLMCDETRVIDLSAVGGLPNAYVTGTAIQHISSNRELLFDWSAFDHLGLADGDPRDRVGVVVNWTHGNSIDIAPDGSLLASFRNLGEITKIDTLTGRVVWRLGGRGNQFSVVENPGAGFAGQHSVRTGGLGEILLMDNVGDPAGSRAEQYVIDERGKNVRLVGVYGSAPAVRTDIGGSVQRLATGHTLVSFGTAGRVEEYDAAGRVVWRIEGDAGYIFRAQRIPSLYAPGIGAAR
jgi:hypothetical protein